jgi:hypothetical protein
LFELLSPSPALLADTNNLTANNFNLPNFGSLSSQFIQNMVQFLPKISFIINTPLASKMAAMDAADQGHSSRVIFHHSSQRNRFLLF